MHQADPPALLRILCVLDVAIQATGSYAAGAVVVQQATKKLEGTEKKQGGHCHNCTGNVAADETDVVDVGAGSWAPNLMKSMWLEWHSNMTMND